MDDHMNRSDPVEQCATPHDENNNTPDPYVRRADISFPGNDNGTTPYVNTSVPIRVEIKNNHNVACAGTTVSVYDGDPAGISLPGS